MTGQIKSYPNLSFKELLEKSNGLEKEKLTYANARWEFLRRNKNFIKDCNCLSGEPLYSKWRIVRNSTILDPALSFDELIEENSHRLIKSNSNDLSLLKADLQACRDLVFILAEDYGMPFSPYSNTPVYFGRDIQPKDAEETGLIHIMINLNYSKNRIIKELNPILDRLVTGWQETDLKERTRKHHSWELYPLYLEIYDLMEKDRMTYVQIEHKLLDEGKLVEDSNKSERFNEIKVKKYYDEAKRIIDNMDTF